MPDPDSTLSAIETATECGGELILFPSEPPIIGDVVLAGADGHLYSRLMVSGSDLGSWPVGGAGWIEHPVEVEVPDGVLAIGRGRCNPGVGDP